MSTGTTITNLVLGYKSEIRVLDIDTVPAPANVASFLGVLRGHPISRFRRLEIIDGKPLAVVTNYMRAELGQRIQSTDLERYSMLEFFRDRLKILLRPIRQVIEARMPDEEVAGHLGIDLTRPVLLLRAWVSNKHGQPVEIADTFYRADRYCYEIVTPPLPKRGILKAKAVVKGDFARKSSPRLTRADSSLMASKVLH
jgi:GntR family transcriptional regulator